jgi:hypothetical protein
MAKNQLNQLKESLGTVKYNKIQKLIRECLAEGMEVEITIPKKKLLKESTLTEDQFNRGGVATGVIVKDGDIVWAHNFNQSVKYAILAVQGKLKNTSNDGFVIDNSKDISVWDSKDKDNEVPLQKIMSKFTKSDSKTSEPQLDLDGAVNNSIKFFAQEIFNGLGKKYSVSIVDGNNIKVNLDKDLSDQINNIKNIKDNNLVAQSSKLSDGSYCYKLAQTQKIAMKA